MKKRNSGSRFRRHVSNFTNELNKDPSVLWAEQQRTIIRVKRDFLQPEEMQRSEPPLSNGWPIGQIMENLFEGTRQFVFAFDIDKIQPKSTYNDELWPHQWYIYNPGMSKWDHGITKVWDMGFTGKGVVVTVLDDGKSFNYYSI